MKKSWPQIFILAGAPVALFGFTLVTGGAPELGLIFFLAGAAAFVLGSIAAIVRFALKRHLVPHLLLLVSGLLLAAFIEHRYRFSLAYTRGAQEDSYQLWISALKGFSGTVYYVGNEGGFSYFRVGDIFPACYKAPTDRIRLPRTFPLGTQAQYRATEDMVYYREPNKS